MNRTEARRVAEVTRRLRLGPGNGWIEVIRGSVFDADKTPEQRAIVLKLWLDTWILPPLDTVVARYIEKRPRR